MTTETESTTEYWNAAPHPQLAHLPQLPHPLSSKVVTATVPATATKKLPTTQIGMNSEPKIKLQWISLSPLFYSSFDSQMQLSTLTIFFFFSSFTNFFVSLFLIANVFLFSFYSIQYQYRLIWNVYKYCLQIHLNFKQK